MESSNRPSFDQLVAEAERRQREASAASGETAENPFRTSLNELLAIQREVTSAIRTDAVKASRLLLDKGERPRVTLQEPRTVKGLMGKQRTQFTPVNVWVLPPVRLFEDGAPLTFGGANVTALDEHGSIKLYTVARQHLAGEPDYNKPYVVRFRVAEDDDLAPRSVLSGCSEEEVMGIVSAWQATLVDLVINPHLGQGIQAS